MLGLLTRHRWLVAASALILALITLWLATRPAGELPRVGKSPQPAPTTNASPELAFFSLFSPLPTPAPAPTAAASTRPLVRQVRPIDGMTVPGDRLRVTDEPLPPPPTPTRILPTPTATATPRSIGHIEAVRPGRQPVPGSPQRGPGGILAGIPLTAAETRVDMMRQAAAHKNHPPDLAVPIYRKKAPHIIRC